MGPRNSRKIGKIALNHRKFPQVLEIPEKSEKNR